jgi:hypothetical protein
MQIRSHEQARTTHSSAGDTEHVQWLKEVVTGTAAARNGTQLAKCCNDTVRATQNIPESKEDSVTSKDSLSPRLFLPGTILRIFAALLLSLAPLASTQSGSITGLVTDATGAVGRYSALGARDWFNRSVNPDGSTSKQNPYVRNQLKTPRTVREIRGFRPLQS